MPLPATMIADDARGTLEELRASLNARIQALLAKLALNEDGKIDREELANAVRVRAQLLALLKREGPVVESLLEQEAARAAGEVLARQPGPKKGFAADAGPELKAITTGLTKDVSRSFRTGHDQLRRAITKGITMGVSLERLTKDVAQAFDTTFLKASSAVDTAIIGTGRAVVMLQAERAAEDDGESLVFKYVGPRDRKTRPFCAERVGRIYTRAAIDEMDNGQLKPVATFGGGYNCRHSWAPLVRADLDRGTRVIDA
jgi:hypothetical protein